MDERKIKFFGRPPKYETPEELQAKITDYFENGIIYRKVVVGPPNNRQVQKIPVITITGLVLHCGFCDRSAFYAYEKKEEFKHTIKTARTFIEREYEGYLQNGGGSAAIFALKNFGWEDKTEVKNSGESTAKVVFIEKGEKKDLEKHIEEVVNPEKAPKNVDS